MSKLEILRIEMNKIKIHNKTNVSKTDNILHILLNISEDHEVAVSKIEHRLRDSSCRLDMEDLKATLSSRYKWIMNHQESRKEELEYAFKVFEKKYTGRCGNCGEYGRKSGECSDKGEEREENDQFRGKCWYCLKHGHKAGNFEKKEQRGQFKRQGSYCY